MIPADLRYRAGIRSRNLLLFLSIIVLIVVMLTYNRRKIEFPPVRAPADWGNEKEARLQKDITIGIISTATFHGQVKKAAMETWWTEERRGMVKVFTDGMEKALVDIPNTIDTACPDTYYFGIWCKNGAMIEHWTTNEEVYGEVKWFVRVMDDTYLHLENLLDLVSQYDYRDKIVLGDMYCVVENYTYPSGGPGIIFSRGVLEDWDWDDWNAPLLEKDQDGDLFADDVLWGEYLLKRNISIINHHGITQSPLDLGSQLMRYFLSFRSSPWPLPFRPVAIHAQKHVQQMQLIHSLLHSIPYTPMASPSISLPECTCRPSSHQKCSWNHDLVDAEICRWASQSLLCFGPGPWPNLPPEYWHDEDMCA